MVAVTVGAYAVLLLCLRNYEGREIRLVGPCGTLTAEEDPRKNCTYAGDGLAERLLTSGWLRARGGKLLRRPPQLGTGNTSRTYSPKGVLARQLPNTPWLRALVLRLETSVWLLSPEWLYLGRQ